MQSVMMATPQLSKQSILLAGEMEMTRAQRPLVLVLIGILTALVVVLVTLVVVILQQSGGTGAPLARGTATPTLTPTPVLNISPAQGWVQTQPKLPFARAVAFGTNDPLTGYVCGSQGVQYGSNGPVVLQFSRTIDGGRTWQSPQTLSFGNGYSTCELHINPTNVKDVLLGRIAGCDGGPCDGNSNLIFDWYRSRDGGQTWSHLTYPASITNRAKGLFPLAYFAWNGSTLYAAIHLACLGACLLSNDGLLVSKNGGAFTEVPTEQIFAPLSKQFVTFTAVFVLAGKVTIHYRVEDYLNHKPITYTVASTSDGGQTWTTATAKLNGVAIMNELIVKVVVHNVLYGAYFDYQKNLTLLVQSTDGGQTWTALPTQPTGGFAVDSLLFATPDGDLYIGIIQYVGSAKKIGIIQRLVPHETTWQMVTSVDSSSPYHHLTAVSWDVTGRTMALWSEVVTTKIVTGGPLPSEVPTGFGLAYHAAVPGQ